MKIERQNKVSLPEETMKKIPDDAKRLGIKTVIFSGGGEPLMNPHTKEVARELKKRGVRVGLNTNGVTDCADISMFDFVRVSVDAATESTFEKIKGHGWQHLNKNLDNMIRGDAELGFAFLITPDNYHEIINFCWWIERFMPDFIHVRPAYLEGEAGIRMKEVMPYIDHIKNNVMKMFEKVHITSEKFDGYWNKRTYDKCRATPLIAVTAADGAFIVCQDVFIRFGDYNRQSFEHIWWSKEHEESIKKIDLGKCPRCVENKYNETIEHFDEIRVDLL